MYAPECARGGFPASLMSQSWVRCEHVHTGGVGGEGAENWCVGGVRSKRIQGLGGLIRCGRSIVELARTCHLQSAFICSLEGIIDMQAEITMQVKGVGSTFASSDVQDNHGENFISTNMSNA